TKETHTLTVSTLVSRHEQQLKEEAGQAKAQLEHALAAQAKETLAKHDAEMAELAALEAELQATKETHTLTVSTLVSRHEQQLKEEAGQAKAQLEHALAAQAKETQAKHDAEMAELRAMRDTQQAELTRLESIFDQLHNESAKMQQMEDEVARLKATNQERESDESQQEVLMLLGSMEIQCRCFREVLEQVLGKEGVEKALKLSEDRGAMTSFLSSFFK
ncbi:hypothetical protein As57867_022281, partial [Aphanomyces stellatus]